MPRAVPPLFEVLSWVISLTLLVSVGLDLRLADFAPVRDRPGMVAAGVLLPTLVLPVLALGLVWLLEPSAAATRSVLLLSACPIGGVSTTYSMLARANPALSVTLTAASCLTGLVTMPMLLFLLMASGDPMRATPAWALIQHLAVLLIPPIALGMAIRARWPAWATRQMPRVLAMAFALLAVLLAMLLVGSARRASATDWFRMLAVVATFVVVAFVVGAGVARMLGGSRADRFTFAAEFGTRNVAVGLAASLVMNMAAEFASLGAIYLAFEIPFMMGAALRHRRRFAPIG